MKQLQKKIDLSFDYLYASSKIKNTEVIAYEYSKILHTGIFIEKKLGIKPAFKDFFPVNNNSTYSEIKDVSFIRTSFHKMNLEWGLFKDDEIKFSDHDIYFICSQFHDLSISDKNADFIGDSLEIFRNYSIKSLGGQFFTDPEVTKLSLKMLNYDGTSGQTFIDICSGTGGFILAAINKLRKDIDDTVSESEFISIVKKSISGKEIDTTVCNAANRNIQTRVGVPYNYVNNEDSLKIDPAEFGKYDCIATNPPFGTKTTIKDETILKNFELANRKGAGKLHPTPPDILFLEQNINLLKAGTGKMAIVLPYQILSGPRTYYIRKWILEHCKVLAVVDLPPETFQPHTGTKTSLLLVEKLEKAISNIDSLDYTIFFAKPKWVGHDRRGLPIYRKNIDGSESDDILCDFDDVYKLWKEYQKGNLIESEICISLNIREILKDDFIRLNALVHVKNNIKSKDEYSGKELSSLVKEIFYPGRFKRNYVSENDNSVPFLGGANITEQIVTTKKYISKKDPHYNQLAVREGWILITRSGTTGIVAIVPKDWDGYAISEHVIRIIPDETKESANFIYAFLQSELAKNQLSKQVFGSVIDEISPESVGKLLIPDIGEKSKKKIISQIELFREQTNKCILCYRNAQQLLNNELNHI